MDCSITFNREVRKQVFDFFVTILHDFPDPVYYEYIRGHVSKASLPVRKYVASKCKGEKLLEYFRLRKNYFSVKGSDVVLKRDPYPKRKRVQSECEAIRGRKHSWKSDKASYKRSFSCSSAISDNTVASSINTDVQLEHEDYVSKFFCDLVIRHEKVDLSSMDYNNLPKKVKRHLYLYYKRKVSNYFAQFPDKYVIDDEWKVSLNLHLPEYTVNTKTKSVDTIPPPDSVNNNSLVVQAAKKSPDLNEQEIQLLLCHTNAILFFMDILTKKNRTLTVQQLGGYLSQAPKELRSFLKFNYKSFKDFFEETSYIFMLSGCEEVTLSKFSRYHKSGVERIGKIVARASIGDISLQTMREKVEELRNKIKTLFSDKESDNHNESRCKVIDEALPDNDTVQQITENQPESPSCCETIEVASNESICTDGKDEKINEQTDAGKSLACCETIDVSNSEPNCTDEKINEPIDVPNILKRLKIDYEFYGASTNDIVFEINGNLYEPNGNPYEGNGKLYDYDYYHNCVDGLRTKDTIDEDSKMIVRIVPTPCPEHKKYLNSSSECNMGSNFNMECRNQKFYEEKTYKFLLIVELFCLEMTEKDFDFTVSNEVNAIQYFIKVLDQPILKSWNVSSLHGTLGKATAEVSSFIKKKYKADNFLSFFQEQPEFEVYPPIVKLSASYKETFARRINALSVSVNRNSKWDLLKLYESSCYKNILIEIFSLFREICHFLKNKRKTKLSRLEGIVTRFPNCLDWIKALEGETVAKKIRCFLYLFDIFEFSFDNYISFQLNYLNNILMKWFENAHVYFENPNKKFDLVSIFHQLIEQSPINGKSDVNVEQLPCHFIKEAIKGKMPLDYHELAVTLPEHLLQEIIESSIGSRTLIEALLKDGQYFLQNGKIDLKTDGSNPVNLDSAIDNSLIKNQNFQSPKEPSNKTDEVASNGSVSNDQTSEKTDPDYCNNGKNASSFDMPLVSSIGENSESTTIDVSSSPISVKSMNDSNDCNQNKSQSLDSECGNCNSQTTVSKEVEEIVYIGSKGDSKIVSLNEHTDQTDLTVSAKDSIEKLNEDSNTKSSDVPFNVVRCETCNQMPHHNMIEHEEDFDSAVEEIDSLIALGEKHSLSSFENEELIYSDEENSYSSIQLERNECVSDARYEEDCTSSQFIDTSEKGNLDTKSLNLNDIEKETMKKYLELLKVDDEVLDIHAEIDTNQKDASSDGNASNEALSVSKASFSSDLNYSKSTVELSNVHTVTDVFKNVINQIEFTKIIENENMSENISEMKYKAELLAKEVFQEKCHEILRSRLFVASTKILFDVKKKYLQKTYGPFDLKSTDTNISKNSTVPDVFKIPISLQHPNSLINLESTVDKDLSHNKDISVEVTFQDKPVSTNNLTVETQVNLNDCNNILVECPLQEEFNSENNKETSASFSSSNGNECHVHSPYLEKVDSKNNLKSNGNLKLIDCQSVPNEYPLQPLTAEIVLLTSDSCIAVAEIDSRKQNIYFLKCVFVCDDQYCCSNCFADLKVGDTVSCFVPPTEIFRKMWIAFMVSKESGSHFDEIDSFNEVIAKQNKGSSMIHNMCVNSKNVLIQTENSSADGCHIDSMLTEQTSQTHLSGDVKLCAITEDSMCQINSLVDSAFTQTVNENNSSECQTEIIDKIDIESQTNHTGNLQEVSSCAEMFCQTDLTGEVRATINVVDTECQTISTGQVMITKYFHL